MRNQSYRAALIVLVVSLAALVALPRDAQAVTVFSQAPVNGAISFASDFQFPNQYADNFSLGSAATVASVKFWGDYAFGGTPTATNNFSIRFYADVAGSPAIVPFYNQAVVATRTPTGLFNNIADPIFEYSALLPISVPLAGGTTYYFSTVDNNAGSHWFWAGDSIGGSPNFERSVDGVAWSSTFFNENLAFQLNNGVQVVPLPAAAWAGFALIGGIGVRRKLARA